MPNTYYATRTDAEHFAGLTWKRLVLRSIYNVVATASSHPTEAELDAALRVERVRERLAKANAPQANG